MKLFLPYTKGYRLWMLLAIICSVGEAVLELLLPQAMSDIVDIGIATGDRNYILMMGLKMLVLAVLALLFGVIRILLVTHNSLLVLFSISIPIFWTIIHTFRT